MISVKTRKVGNAVALSIPKQLHVEVGAEYVVYKCQNGGLIFSPKIKNPFSSEAFYQNDEDTFWQELAEEELGNA